MKCLCNICIELNIELLVDGDINIALMTALIHPFLEDISETCEDYVTNVGAGHLPDLPYRWQAVDDNFVSH
jgi:hypothetical protein